MNVVEPVKVYEGGKMTSQDDLVDAKIAAAEARTDTKVVRLEGKIDLVLSRLDGMSANHSKVHATFVSPRNCIARWQWQQPKSAKA
jgi:hypothetical protein